VNYGARLLALSAVCLSACELQFDPCFDAQSIVSDVRVLGVRADPPQALFDAATRSVESVRVRMLVADPSAIPQADGGLAAAAIVPEVGADICSADADGGCGMTRIARSEAPLASEAAFEVLVPPASIERALELDPLAGYGGPRVRLDLSARLPDGRTLQARKTLLFSEPGAIEPINHGFEILGLRVQRPSHAHHQDFSLPMPADDETLAPGDLLLLDRFDAAWFTPVLSPGAVEEYDTVDLAGRPVHLQEKITFQFFSTVGRLPPYLPAQLGTAPFFDPIEATHRESVPGDGVLGVTRMVARKAGTGLVWIVARDSRGAEAWLRLPWVAQDAYRVTAGTALEPQLGHSCEAK
jgi:hypothetical protein